MTGSGTGHDWVELPLWVERGGSIGAPNGWNRRILAVAVHSGGGPFII
jgi:hypothetical protein